MPTGLMMCTGHANRHYQCSCACCRCVVVLRRYQSQVQAQFCFQFRLLRAGRKHQLRVHCSTALCSPILGDQKHGVTRSRLQLQLITQLEQHSSGNPQQQTQPEDLLQQAHSEGPTVPWQPDSSGLKVKGLGLQLHSAEVSLTRSYGANVHVKAPLPDHMLTLIKLLGMRSPGASTDSARQVTGTTYPQ